MNNQQTPPLAFEVDLPAGGKLSLRTQEEVDMWEELSQKYIRDYALSKTNDLALLGVLLSQHLTVFRAQQRANGMEPELDAAKVPTGRYKVVQMSKQDQGAAQNTITKAAEQIQQLEKSLGIDKKSREAGGEHKVGEYVRTLKRPLIRWASTSRTGPRLTRRSAWSFAGSCACLRTATRRTRRTTTSRPRRSASGRAPSWRS
jgi:hypothetical protein